VCVNGGVFKLAKFNIVHIIVVALLRENSPILFEEGNLGFGMKDGCDNKVQLIHCAVFWDASILELYFSKVEEFHDLEVDEMDMERMAHGHSVDDVPVFIGTDDWVLALALVEGYSAVD
jgi:hypothetical protein